MLPYFFLSIEGSGYGSSSTRYGSGSRCRRPKNLRIRIRNTRFLYWPWCRWCGAGPDRGRPGPGQTWNRWAWIPPGYSAPAALPSQTEGSCRARGCLFRRNGERTCRSSQAQTKGSCRARGGLFTRNGHVEAARLKQKGPAGQEDACLQGTDM